MFLPVKYSSRLAVILNIEQIRGRILYNQSISKQSLVMIRDKILRGQSTRGFSPDAVVVDRANNFEFKEVKTCREEVPMRLDGRGIMDGITGARERATPFPSGAVPSWGASPRSSFEAKSWIIYS
jgi:hypothetical protein